MTFPTWLGNLGSGAAADTPEARNERAERCLSKMFDHARAYLAKLKDIHALLTAPAGAGRRASLPHIFRLADEVRKLEAERLDLWFAFAIELIDPARSRASWSRLSRAEIAELSFATKTEILTQMDEDDDGGRDLILVAGMEMVEGGSDDYEDFMDLCDDLREAYEVVAEQLGLEDTIPMPYEILAFCAH